MRILSLPRRIRKSIAERLRRVAWRSLTANFMMLSFIIMTSVGAAMLLPAAGFITAGIACGFFGYLLGSD